MQFSAQQKVYARVVAGVVHEHRLHWQTVSVTCCICV
jgi:hypothetical protein